MKKFIALALTLAMMVSCLVLTASAESTSGVAVILEGPANIESGANFQVKVRLADPENLVGGVQAVVNATGAEVVDVRANDELLNWNNTSDVQTIYKLENNDITFAALNSLNLESYETRVWLIIDYKATSDDVSVVLDNVKVSDKTANLIADVEEKELDTINIVDPAEDAYIALNSVGIMDSLARDTAEEQGIVAKATYNEGDAEIVEIGVLYYPTSLLAGAELTVDTDGAAKASLDNQASAFANLNGQFSGVLRIKFGGDTTKALKFLGTKITVRVYYKTAEGDIVYASNTNVAEGTDTAVKNGIASKAVLNIVRNAGRKVTEAKGTISLERFAEADAGLGLSNANWEANRADALKFVVENLSTQQ